MGAIFVQIKIYTQEFGPHCQVFEKEYHLQYLSAPIDLLEFFTQG